MTPWPTHNSLLLAGCGGGFDVVCALPLALHWKARGQAVHLSSYSFSELREIEEAEKINSQRPYLQQALESETVGQIHELIQDYRHKNEVMPRRNIPC